MRIPPRLSETFCPTCGAPIPLGRRFCGSCGASSGPAESATPETAAVAGFRRHAQQVARSSGSLGQVVDAMLRDAEAMGIEPQVALDIIELVGADQSVIPVQCWYDDKLADQGVAGGTTLLSVRFKNSLDRTVERLDVHVVHPETNVVVSAPSVTMLMPGATKEIDVPILLTRMGRHVVRDAFVTVKVVASAPYLLRADTPIRVNAEDGSAARTNINSVSQTIQTHGGGVISADGLAPDLSRPTASEQWRPVALVTASPEELAAAQERADQQIRADTSAKHQAEQAALQPMAPTGLTALARSDGVVVLNWVDPGTNRLGYHLERSADGLSFTKFATASPDTSAFRVDGLAAGSSYAFRICAFNDAGTSPHSNTATVMTANSPAASANAPAPPPVVNIVNNVTPGVHAVAAPSDKAVRAISITKVIITIVIVVGVMFVALLVGVVLL